MRVRTFLQQEREGMRMSIVIIGGHDRMVRQYHDICKAHKCKAKVFTQMTGDLKKQVGRPDLFVLFTNTVSHKMSNVPWRKLRRTTLKSFAAIPAARRRWKRFSGATANGRGGT